jgi:hypothetical protein
MTKTEQKYKKDERVKVQGRTRYDTGIIIDVGRVFHTSLVKWVWGYKIKFDNDGPGLSFTYIPEGYLRKELSYLRYKKINKLKELIQ